MAVIRAERVLIEGSAEGPVMLLGAPLSFWGGVDPESGRITQPRHPDHERCIAHQILALERTIGSSSSSAILLELIHRHQAPAALVLGAPDAILCLGVVVAQEMGLGAIPVLQCPMSALAGIARARISPGGIIEAL